MRYIFVFFLLVGCQTQEVRLAKFSEQCVGLGYESGTNLHLQCVSMLQTDDQKERARISAALENMKVKNNTINCDSTTYGNRTNTNCRY